jgi:hypothetical protein
MTAIVLTDPKSMFGSRNISLVVDAQAAKKKITKQDKIFLIIIILSPPPDMPYPPAEARFSANAVIASSSEKHFRKSIQDLIIIPALTLVNNALLLLGLQSVRGFLVPCFLDFSPCA